MKQNMYTIYDAAAEAYLPPFFLHNKGQAIRTFTDCINDDNHQFGKHPQHYTLYYCGEFDDETGVTTGFPPAALVNGLELVNKDKQDDHMDMFAKLEAKINKLLEVAKS